MKKKVLTADDLLAFKPQTPIETVEVPELGGVVTVKGMNAGELGAFFKAASVKGAVDEATFAAKLVAACVLGSPDKFDVVSGWPGSAVARLSQAAMKLNGLAPGNSEATDSDGSYSA